MATDNAVSEKLKAAEIAKAAELRARKERKKLVADLRHAKLGGFMKPSEVKRFTAVARGLTTRKKTK